VHTTDLYHDIYMHAVVSKFGERAQGQDWGAWIFAAPPSKNAQEALGMQGNSCLSSYFATLWFCLLLEAWNIASHIPTLTKHTHTHTHTTQHNTTHKHTHTQLGW